MTVWIIIHLPGGIATMAVKRWELENLNLQMKNEKSGRSPVNQIFNIWFWKCGLANITIPQTSAWE